MTLAPSFVAPPFRPHPLLVSGHAQTIFPAIYPRPLKAPEAWRALAEPRTFTLPDGDRLAGVYHPHPDDPDKQRPLVVVLHGLEGSAESHYVQGMSAKAMAVGFHSLRLNFRNCGHTEHLARGLYNAALTEDVHTVMAAMAAEGHRRIYLAGVSLGGNLLLKLVASYGETPPAWLMGAGAVCPSIDLARGSEAFKDGFNKVYDRFFLDQLKLRIHRKITASPDGERFAAVRDRLARVTTMREFDELITAPFSGFADATDYYRRASAGDDLGRIAVPTLILAAQDDPFVRIEAFEARRALIEGNPHLTAIYPAHGGHVGFYEWPWSPQPEPWMDEYWSENQTIAHARWVWQQQS